MRHRCVVLFLMLAASAAAADRADAVTILTQNMDAGTDQTYIIGAALQNASTAGAVDLTAQELLQASNIPQRTQALAVRIAATKPDLVALQEVTRWEIDLTPPAAPVVLDQLDQLLFALGSLGTAYRVVALNNVNDLTLPGNQVAAVRFTDRNALLVRSDLGPPALHFSNVHTHLFDTVFNFAGLPISAGWISADVHTANRHFRLITTHLTSPIPGVKEATGAQVGQAKELLQALRNTQIPVVLCGDFNSDANGGQFVDATPTAALISTSGYPEVWPQTHTAAEPGLTWPYYAEDLFPPPPFVGPAPPLERIDLFFEKGMQVVGSELVLAPTGTEPPDASDHAGVIATLRP